MPHFSDPEPGYNVCIGCVFDAGQEGLMFLFVKVIVSPALIVRILGEKPADVISIVLPEGVCGEEGCWLFVKNRIITAISSITEIAIIVPAAVLRNLGFFIFSSSLLCL